MMAIKKTGFTKGFTLIEGIIGTVLFVMVAGMAIMLLTNTLGSYNKGESASSSVQEASILINRIRYDLLQLTFAEEGSTFDFFQSEKTDTTSVATIVKFNRENGTLETIAATPEEDGLITRFYISNGANKEVIQYSYNSKSRSIYRQVGTKKAKAYAVPRLKNFSMTLRSQKKPVPAAQSSQPPATETTSILDLEGLTMEPVKICQIWFKVVVSIQEETKRKNQRMKEVNVESLIFPKILNKQFQGRWKEWK